MAKPLPTAKSPQFLHFLQNFCDFFTRKRSPDNQIANRSRLTMIQPYPYWLFETAVCYFVCLYTNDLNGGQLDDPMGVKIPNIDGWSTP